MVTDHSVHVIVLGDLSRSPRILQHALCLTRERWVVTMSGYCKKSDIYSADGIIVRPISNVTDWSSRFVPARLNLVLKLDFAAYCFGGVDKSVQHMCVSNSMKVHLNSYGIPASVFYDRPPDNFKPTTAEEAHNLFNRLKSQYEVFSDPNGYYRRTRFTEINALPAGKGGAKAQWRTDRPALVVSSCSWTLDDDFELMMKALNMYNEKASHPVLKLPQLLAVITGRGPMKAYYQAQMKKLNWKHVSVLTPWLDASDYPILLGCADVGVSLHRSSSGLDLPMKVVDMIGVELPVLALTYQTLYELLPADRFGRHFETATQLSDLLCTLLQPISNTQVSESKANQDQLSVYRNHLSEYNRQTARGYNHWRDIALPIFQQAV